MRTWDDWSDFEINKKVSEINGELIQVPDGFQSEIIGDVEYYYDSMRMLWSCHSDYCNNWEDIGPIIYDNEISLIPPVSNGTNGWRAERFYPSNCGKIIDFIDKNPRRAAAIVFLMMNGVNQD